jgi:hypothetical protein
MKPWQAPLNKAPNKRWNEEQRESTQVWVKRAKPKGCKGINYVSSITRSISHIKKRKEGKLLRAISLERALIATKIEVGCIFYKAINTLYLVATCVLYKATDTLC